MAVYQGFYHYLPVNDAAMRWGLYLTGAGQGAVPPGHSYPPDGHPGLYHFQWSRGRVLPESQIIMISDGRGEFESEAAGAVPVEPDSLLFLFPGVWHRYRPDGATGWRERWISFNGELNHRLIESGLLRPDAAVRRAKAPRSLARSFDRLLQRVQRDPNQNSILLSLQALAFIGEVVESVAAGEDVPGVNRTVRRKQVRDPLVRDALDLIWTHSHRALSVQNIADQLATSRRALERRFMAAAGRTLLEEINACRTSRAKRLLCETDLGVKTVARLAGFPSEERMRVAFIRSEHAAPSEYRRLTLRNRQPRPGRSAQP